MRAIERALSDAEIQEMVIARMWIDGDCSEWDARRSCSIQQLDFKKVEEFHGQFYHEQECKSAGVKI